MKNALKSSDASIMRAKLDRSFANHLVRSRVSHEDHTPLTRSVLEKYFSIKTDML